MFVPSLLGGFSKISILSKLLKGLAGLILGGATLWWIVDRVGPVDSPVLVHVTEPDVEVTVGGLNFRIEERRYVPLEYRFRPGRYLLRMTRGDRILYEEWFTVRRSAEVMLTAGIPLEHPLPIQAGK
jgi:hypothetical protein